MLEVRDLQDYVDAGLAVAGAGFDVSDVGVLVADDGSDLLQHAEAVVAKEGELDGICDRLPFFVAAGPLHVDATVRFVHEIGDVRTVDGVDRDALATSYIADNRFAAGGVTTLGAIDQQVAVTLHDDGVVVSAKDAADHAGKSTGRLRFAFG